MRNNYFEMVASKIVKQNIRMKVGAYEFNR